MPRVDEYASTSGLDNDDTVLGVVDGALKNVPLPASRGYIDASHFADLNELVLNTAESLTGWVTTNPTDGYVAPLLDPTTPAPGSTNSVTAIIKTHSDIDSLMYINLPANQPVGGYVEAAFYLRTNFNGLENMMSAFVSSGVDATGTISIISDFDLQFPSTSGPAATNMTWYKIRVPLTGFTNVRCIGIRQTPPLPTNNSARGQFWFGPVSFREATGFDRAVYSAPAGSQIVIPPNYTTSKFQLPVWREAANITWTDLRRGTAHERYRDAVIHADDFMLDYTGTLESSGDLAYIFMNVMVPGDTFEFHRNGQYKCNAPTDMLGRRSLTFLGNNATIFSDVERSIPFIHMYQKCADLRFEKLNIVGFNNEFINGSTFAAVAGTPTVVSTTMQLNAQNEEVKFPDNGGGREFAYARDKDLYNKWEITISDTAQVANDWVVTAYDEFDLANVLYTETWTVTATPTARMFKFKPNNLRQRIRVHVKKATATANTGTITSARTFGQQGHRTSIEGNAAWLFDDSAGLTLVDCRAEGCTGDAFQNSAILSTDINLIRLHSRGCNRQGMSFNFSADVHVEDCTIEFSGRSGIDVEPYLTNWYCENMYFSNTEIYCPGINGISQGNWGRITNVHWRNTSVIDCGSSAFGGGGIGGSVVGFSHIRFHDYQESGGGGTLKVDVSFVGQNMYIANVQAWRGIQIMVEANVDRNSNPTYPGGFHVNGWSVTNPGLFGGLVIESGVPNVVVEGGPADTYNQFPMFGRGGSHGGVGHAMNVRHGSALHMGVLHHRLPKTYPGIAHTSAHFPQGFDLLGESLNRVGGIGGSNTAVTLQTMTARTTTGTTTGVDVGEASVIRLRLYCSAISGGGDITSTFTGANLAVDVQQSHDNATWATVDSFRTIRYTTTTEWCEQLEIRNTFRYLRLSYTLGGTTPSFTFEVKGDKSVVANNFNALTVPVTASASTHAVTFPAKSMPNITGITFTTDSNAGTLVAGTTYYYRIGSRTVNGGPIIPMAETSITIPSGKSSTYINTAGYDNIANGVQIPAATMYRGTTPGVYTHRMDYMPNARLFVNHSYEQAWEDFGSFVKIYVRLELSAPTTGGYPLSVPWRTGSFTPVDETGWELDTSYEIQVQTNWNSGHPYVTSKARTGFTINFPTAAPGDGSGRVSWELRR